MLSLHCLLVQAMPAVLTIPSPKAKISINESGEEVIESIHIIIKNLIKKIMKKFAKFIPVALGLLTLASCSNDDLFSESQDAVQLNDGDMVVTMTEPQEDGDAFTRGYTSRDAKSRRWFSAIDKLAVYGELLGAYDTYMFKGADDNTFGYFERVSNNGKPVVNPMWAIFPLEQIIEGKWTQLDGLYNSKVTVDMSIPQLVTYDAAYDAANYSTNKQPYYLDNLPRWGKVTSVNDGKKLETALNWMTGILRLQLAGAPKYSNGIRVQMFENGDRTKPIRLNSVNNDYWTVEIARNNMPTTGASIEYTDGDYAADAELDGALYVYIPDLPKLTDEDRQKAVVFLPLPVTPGKQVDIVVSVWDYAKAKRYWGGKVNPSASTWKWKEQAVYTNKTIKLGRLYGNSSEYNLALDGTTPGAITDALELIDTDKDEITLVANNPIDVCKNQKQTTILIPNKVGKKKITLDLRAGLTGCTNDETLTIAYKDVTNKFEGNVVLLTPASDKTNPVTLNVDLDKSGFGIVGGGCLNWNGASSAVNNIDIDAKEFVLGNGDVETPTKITLTKTPKFSKNVATFTVAKETVLTANLVVDQTTSKDPEKWTYGKVKTINVNGYLKGNIDATTKAESDWEVAVNVDGLTIDGTTIGAKAPKVEGSILTNGTVTIGTAINPAGLAPDNQANITGQIAAGKAISATGFVLMNTGTSITSGTTISLSGQAHVSACPVTAEEDIEITEEAFVGVGAITSNKGNITINNAYPINAYTYAGAITADKGKVYLNQVGAKRSTFTGEIKANVFEMEGVTVTTGAVTAHSTATINVDAQEGACPAVTGSLTFDNPTTNVLNLTQGYVKKIVNPADVETSLTFSDEAKYAAIGSVANPDKLIPTNESIWNGDWRLANYSSFFGSGNYNHDNGRIWTATQLGYQNYDTSNIALEIRSNINLNDEPWPGINATNAVTISGSDKKENKKISKLNLIGNKAKKTAGFYNSCDAELKVSNLTFDGVKTTIAGVSGGVYAKGIGAVVGIAAEKATLTRVIVKLAGENFGTAVDPATKIAKNAQTGRVGGLIGFASKTTELIGCQVDANDVPLTGYNCMGGFIGRSFGAVTIKMDEGDDSKGIAEMYPKVENLSFYVTYDLTQGPGAQTNDPEQGTTGWFIGSIDVNHNLTIADVNNDDIKRNIVQASGSLANEDVASYITTTHTLYYFRRDFAEKKADQTLVGNSGFYTSTPDDGGTPGAYTINGVRYYIYKSGVATLMPPDAPRFYSLNLDPYKH